MQTDALSHADAGAAACGLSALKVYASIFERSAILSNNSRSVLPACQGTRKQGVGLPSAHQRYARTNDEHVFASFSAQAFACEGPSHISRSNNSDGTPSTSRIHSPHECVNSTCAGQVPSATFCGTPGWVPGAPLREQPGVCLLPVAFQPPAACAPMQADILSSHSAAGNAQHSHEGTDLPRINSCSDAASQNGHVDAFPGAANTLSDVKFSRTVHACEPEDADKPERTTSQATYHLPGWVPGAPFGSSLAF